MKGLCMSHAGWERLLLTTALVGFFSAFGLLVCGRPLTAQAAAAPVPAELVGAWELVTLQAPGQAAESTSGLGLTLTFEADGKVSGSGGCNSFGGTATTDDQGRLQFPDLVSTLRGCPEPIGGREARYFLNLREARSYTLDGATLRLGFAQQGRQLVFQRVGTGGATPGLPNTGAGALSTDAPLAGLGLLVGASALLGAMAIGQRRLRRLS